MSSEKKQAEPAGLPAIMGMAELERDFSLLQRHAFLVNAFVPSTVPILAIKCFAICSPID